MMIYALNGIDLLSIANTTAGTNQILWSATYNSQHEPLTTTDAAGQVTKYTYNAAGQALSVTDPLEKKPPTAIPRAGLPYPSSNPSPAPSLNSPTTASTG